jgi:hypothetical protein
MERAAAISRALERRQFAAELAPRIERLLDGIEDRARLRCCSSGCYVCVQQILAVLAEVEAATAALPSAPARVPATS